MSTIMSKIASFIASLLFSFVATFIISKLSDKVNEKINASERGKKTKSRLAGLFFMLLSLLFDNLGNKMAAKVVRRR